MEMRVPIMMRRRPKSSMRAPRICPKSFRRCGGGDALIVRSWTKASCQRHFISRKSYRDAAEESPTPAAAHPREVRTYARNVLSAARWSLATLPLFSSSREPKLRSQFHPMQPSSFLLLQGLSEVEDDDDVWCVETWAVDADADKGNGCFSSEIGEDGKGVVDDEAMHFSSRALKRLSWGVFAIPESKLERRRDEGDDEK